MSIEAQQKNVPILRFPEFNDEWLKKPFSSLYEFKSTNSYSRNQLNYNKGNVYNIHYGDIHTKFRSKFELSYENVPFINLDITLDRVSEDKYCKEGDLVIADASEDYNDIGKTIEIENLNGKKVLAGLHTFLARQLNNDIYIGFGAYLMAGKSVRKKIRLIAQGTKVLGISMGRMGKIKLPVPNNKEEQQKIASFLSAVDNKLEKLNRKKELWEQYKKGIMQNLFSQKSRFKDDSGDDYPDWEEKRLGDIFDISVGGDVRKINFSKNRTNKFNIPVYANALQNQGLYGYTDTPKVVDGAVTVTGRGDVGYAEARLLPFVPVVRLLVLLPKHETSIVFFKNAINEMNIFIESTGVPQLTAPQISRYKIFFPTFHEQTKIANLLSAIDDKINLISIELTYAQAFKKGLLQQMFV